MTSQRTLKWYNWMIIIGFVILFGWCVIVNSKYNNLQKDYNLLKNDNTYIIDSLKNQNLQSKNKIEFLLDSLENVNLSLNNNVNKIESIKKEEFTVSSSFSESTIQLKNNLLCTNL